MGQSGSLVQSILKTKTTANNVINAKPSSTDAKTTKSVELSLSNSVLISVDLLNVRVVCTTKAVWKQQARLHKTARGKAILIDGPKNLKDDGIFWDGRYPPKPRDVWMLAAATKSII